MTRWEIKKEYIDPIFFSNDNRKIRFEFYRGWGGMFTKKNIEVYSNIFDIGNHRIIIENLFNTIHNKKCFKNYKIYQFRKYGIVFAKKDLKCIICHDNITNKENSFFLTSPVFNSGYIPEWQVPKCFRCTAIEKIKQ